MLVCHSYPPVLGGSEIEAQRVSEELQKRGHKPRIVCAGGEPMPPVTEWVDPVGLRVRLYGGNQKKPYWRDVVYALGVAWTLIKERRDYDVAYFLMQGLHLATGLPVARLLGKPIVMKFSCSGIVAGMQNSWIGRLELMFLRLWADKILVLNPGMTQEALDVGFKAERLGWMPNPVDTDYFRPSTPQERLQHRQELGVEADTPLMVFVGRLDHQKKLPWILGSFAQVVRQRPRAKLALIGDGPLRADVLERIQALNLNQNVIVAGRVPMPSVLKWLQAADACMLVSEVEGLPCALIEAMSAGVPPVVSDIPAHTQLIDHGVHGMITPLGDEAAIAEAIVKVLDDPALRNRLAAAARQRMMESFCTEVVVKRYEALFTECTAEVA
jgi:glycosyltransferase involved in cell wall biosynthesis